MFTLPSAFSDVSIYTYGSSLFNFVEVGLELITKTNFSKAL